MIHTVDLFKKIIDDFAPNVVIKSVVFGIDTVITVCDIMHIRENSIITINSIQYTVVSVDETLKQITISGVQPILKGDILYGAKPFYFHGTPVATGNELTLMTDVTKKTPLIYLLEVIFDRFDEDAENSLDRESDVNLFFLDEANFKDWDTDQHYSGAIKPMANLAHMFKEHLKYYVGVGVIEESTMTYHAKFGLSLVTNSGHTKNLFPENFSGVQLRIKIPFLKSLTCDC
jgi:hypothetical protein